MNEKLLWAWRVAVLLLLLFIGDSLRNIYRATPSLPYDFDKTIQELSRDVSAIREKITPKPHTASACPPGTEDTGSGLWVDCTPRKDNAKK